MAKNITIDLVNNKITADALVLYDAVTLVVITGASGTFSADAERTPKLTVAWHRFPLLEDNTNWKINEDGSNATIEFVLNSFELKDSFVHIPAKGYRQFEFNVTIPKNNSAVASARLNVKNNTLEGIPFSQQDRDKLDSIDLSLYYTKVEVDDLLKDIEPGGGGETYTFLEPLSVDKDNVVSIDLTAYAKLTDLPNVPTLVSAFTNDAGYITLSALNGYATESFVTSQGYAKESDIPVVPTKISAFTNDTGFITLAQVPTYDLTPYALKTDLFSKSFADLTNVPTTIAGYGITDVNINGRVITLGGNSIEVPEGGSTYTLTKEAVDGVIGASTAGSTAKFYNEQGAFTEVDMSAYATSNSVALSISTHNTDATAHTNLFALKVDTETYNTAITAINTALDGKENTGVAQGLVDTHATITASSDTLGHIKVDNDTITVDENGVATAHAVGHNIFDIFYSMSSKAPAGAMDLSLGTLIASCDTVFPDFWSECVARKAEGSIRTLTEEEWQAEATANGSCGAFVVDEEAKSVRLPKITNMIQPGDVGVFAEAGLPNITGTATQRAVLRDATGGFIPLISKSDGVFATQSTDYTANTLSCTLYSTQYPTPSQLVIDASRVNSIYGNSATVQPPAVGAKLYIQVFTSAVPASMAQAGEFINMLESYLPLSGGTMTGGVLYDHEPAVNGSTTASSITVNGGQGWGFGGSVAVYGSTHATRAGWVIIRAYDGTDEKRLEVRPDGTFNLDGQSVLNPIGTVIAFAGNSAPTGYLICNGAAVSRTTYAKLFAIIGTTYGTGDGSTTFNLPNLTDKFIMGNGTAGTSKAAGLPNIVGGAGSPDYIYGQNTSGAFYTSALTSTGGKLSSGSTARAGNLGFRASDSNSIYGKSTTVQPPALTMRFYIKY